MKSSICITCSLLPLIALQAFPGALKQQHIDFGHVPMGAERMLRIELCPDDTNTRISHIELPERFLTDSDSFPIIFDKETLCQDLNLAFHPEIRNEPFTHYGRHSQENAVAEGTDIVVISNGERLHIGTVSGTGVSQDHWLQIYPPEAGNYIYTTSIAYPGKASTAISKPFAFNQLDHLWMLRPNQALNFIPTDIAPLWETHQMATAVSGYCGADLHSNNIWLAVSNHEQNRLSIHDTFNIFRKSSSKNNRRGLYRICNAVFDKGGDILFSLGFKNSSGMSVETQLTAWAFNQTIGELSGPISEKQVGHDTDNSPLRPPHALASSVSGYVFATHLHGSRSFDARYYFHRSENRFEQFNRLDGQEDSATMNMDLQQNGPFIVSTPHIGKTLVIRECYSALCQTTQRIVLEDTHSDKAQPTDARFTHRSQQLAVSAIDSNALFILKRQADSSWKISQILMEEEGAAQLDSPQNLSFSDTDRWLAVATQSFLLIFERLEYYRFKKRFRWPAGQQEWWQEYLSQLLVSERAAKQQNTEE